MPETVTIVREGRVPLPSGPGALREMIEIVYQAGGLFPRTVYVDPAHDGPGERARVIAEDLRLAREFTPQTLQLP